MSKICTLNHLAHSNIITAHLDGLGLYYFISVKYVHHCSPRCSAAAAPQCLGLSGELRALLFYLLLPGRKRLQLARGRPQCSLGQFIEVQGLKKNIHRSSSEKSSEKSLQHFLFFNTKMSPNASPAAATAVLMLISAAELTAASCMSELLLHVFVCFCFKVFQSVPECFPSF